MSLLSFAQRLDRAQHGEAAQPEVTPASIHSETAQGQPLVESVRAAGTSHEQPPRRRYQPPPVDASRIVERPVPRFQKESPRDFQIRQLERRFPSLQKAENDSEATLSFQLVPSDPDFPFEMAGLDCVLRVPFSFPGHGKPSLAVKNKDMPRGYQINVERGLDALVQATPHATLLSLVNALDKRLEALLTVEKAETIKLMPNAPRIPDQPGGTDGTPIKALHEIPPVERPKPERPQYTLEQRQAAQAKRSAETRQLEARLGRLPRFSKSSDNIVFTIPITPRSPGDLPVPLQSVRIVQLFVPLLYPLQHCRVEIPGVSREAARKAESAFGRRAEKDDGMSLMAQVNYFAQHMHSMATEPDIAFTEPVRAVSPPLMPEAGGTEVSNKAATDDNDRPHIKIIPRPPEWTTGGEEETDSDSDFSDSYDSGDEMDDHGGDQSLSPRPEDASAEVAERGISLSFPSLEMYNIELLELTSLSLSVKCTRCKTFSDVANLRSSAPRHADCSKCAQPFSVTYRPVLMHANSVRAGYLDLTGCTISDMLPSTFVPTCSTCSTAVPSPGVVSVRGDAASIAVCRDCHRRLTFKIPETKFMLVSASSSLHPRHLLPLRRKPAKAESLGIVAGQELPRRGRCAHYAKSYRWFRFSCCGKVYACDRCHDAAEAHPNEHANRMICGFCSREQHYRPEECGLCRQLVVGKKGSGFWEGGKGTRDKARMSRKDPRKYKRRPGTRVGGTNKVPKGGIGGGGESAKKA
ncbi:MAG: hypothetical protein Q9193_002824 [Seirophora villosa]